MIRSGARGRGAIDGNASVGLLKTGAKSASLQTPSEPASQARISKLRSDENRFWGEVSSALTWTRRPWTLYVYPASVLADLFFPSSDPLDGLLAAYGVFEAGFLMRRPPRPGPIEDSSTAARANPGPSWITVAGCHRGRTLAADPRQRPRNPR
jgi:hypothetical protein